MMRSMYSAVSGLKSHQTKMDVIGNNVSNVNTVSFKSSAVTFNDIMYQTIASASGANAETGTGGVNAKQIGLGVAVGSTQVSITTAGAAQTTGNPFDVRITDANSTNFFIVNNGSENLFTRAGSFYVDGSGNLCMTSTGYKVMGWQAVEDPATGERSIKKDTVSALTVMQTANLTSNPEATTKAYVGGILDKETADLNSDKGLSVNLNLYDKRGYQYTAKFQIKPQTAGTDDGKYTVKLTNLYDSENKDLLLKYKTDGSLDLDANGNLYIATPNYDENGKQTLNCYKKSCLDLTTAELEAIHENQRRSTHYYKFCEPVKYLDHSINGKIIKVLSNTLNEAEPVYCNEFTKEELKYLVPDIQDRRGINNGSTITCNIYKSKATV